MADFDKLAEDLRQNYDELRLKVHLGSKDAQDEWAELQERWTHFENQANLKKSREDVGDAVEILGSELKEAFGRIRKAL